MAEAYWTHCMYCHCLICGVEILEDYLPRARVECQRFIALLRTKCGPEPEGARFAIKSFLHDFGNYLDVVCYFDETLPESVAYALRCEDNLPATWDDESRTPLS